METVTLQMVPGSSLLTDEEFFQFCQTNRALRIERNHKKEIIIMSPTGSEASRVSMQIGIGVGVWNMNAGMGFIFGADGGFSLPDGSVLAPDLAWITRDRWNALAHEQQKRFAPICPDFVMELKSPSDRWADLQDKAKRWLLNGCRMVWLIDPDDMRVEVHQPEVVTAHDLRVHARVSGEPVLPGFVADLGFLLG